MTKFSKIALSSFVIIGVAIPSIANATPFASGPRVRPCNVESEACRLPSPWEVPGKEYSNRVDVNDEQTTPTVVPEQILAWDGKGGRTNSFNYSGSREGDLVEREVDALANSVDTLFKAVVDDKVWLLFSTETDNRIFYEDPGTATGGIWATPQQIDRDMATIDPNPGFQPNLNPSNMDVDGLEVWGLDGPGNDDSERYSLAGDPNDVSIWAYNKLTEESIPFLFNQQVLDAILPLFDNTSIDISSIDIDGLMVFGSEILFSLAPIDLNGGGITDNAGDIDGGEIFYWSGIADESATFLFHGGHFWGTAFNVKDTYGTASENVNALEAVAAPVPEPTSVLGLLSLGVLGVTTRLKGRIK